MHAIVTLASKLHVSYAIQSQRDDRCSPSYSVTRIDAPDASKTKDVEGLLAYLHAVIRPICL